MIKRNTPSPDHRNSLTPPPSRTGAAPSSTTVQPAAHSAHTARAATAHCHRCSEPVGPSRYRETSGPLCRPCGELARMSRKQRVARLRDNPTNDLLHRTALLPADVDRGSLREAFPWTLNGDVAGRLATLSTEVLQFTALQSGADAPLIAQEIGRRGAAFDLAAQGGWTDADPLSDNSVRMVRCALECDETLTLDQLKQIASSRFRDAIVRRIADLDDATAAQLAAEVDIWEAERLAVRHRAPVSALTALAERGPSIAYMVVRDPRATAQTIAAIAEHHCDQAWSHVAIAALTHPNVGVALLPVPLLVSREASRARMQGYLDARLGVGTPERRTAGQVQEAFPGTLNDLLDVVATIHSTVR